MRDVTQLGAVLSKIPEQNCAFQGYQLPSSVTSLEKQERCHHSLKESGFLSIHRSRDRISQPLRSTASSILGRLGFSVTAIDLQGPISGPYFWNSLMEFQRVKLPCLELANEFL